MDSTRAGLLLSEAKNLLRALGAAQNVVFNGKPSSKRQAQYARLGYLINLARTRKDRRYDLWCDSND